MKFFWYCFLWRLFLWLNEWRVNIESSRLFLLSTILIFCLLFCRSKTFMLQRLGLSLRLCLHQFNELSSQNFPRLLLLLDFLFHFSLIFIQSKIYQNVKSSEIFKFVFRSHSYIMKLCDSLGEMLSKFNKIKFFELDCVIRFKICVSPA